MHLLPPEALIGAAHAMGNGADKYEPHDWRNAPTWNRYYDPAMRHLLAWQQGEEQDPDSGLSHLDHALASLMILSALVKTGAGEDDRFLQGAEQKP